MKAIGKYVIAGWILAAPLWMPAQSEVARRMKEHITYLADDALAGRETGSEGEEKASQYIIDNFKSVGVMPAGEDGGYLQPFSFVARLVPVDGTNLSVNGKPLVMGHAFQVLPSSGSAVMEGAPVAVGFGIDAPELGHNDYKGVDVKGKVVVIQRGTPDGNDPHGKFGDYAALDVKIDAAVAQGVAGIVFVDAPDQSMEAPIIDYARKVARQAIPIVYVHPDVSKAGPIQQVKGTIGLEERHVTGHNVIGKLDFGAEYTLVIGAHYDHLGYGEEGSLHRGERAIHNGADDNASGTAMVIELARLVQSQQNLQRYNYVFMAFSGEEKGLLGSNYFAKNPTIDLAKVSAMINFDMVGRLDPEKNTLGINAVGTSPFWKEAIAAIQIDDMKVKTAESGVGPSDHTSFYLKDLPVLHFFSGTHADYHKPTDDEPLINYDGADKIFRYVEALLLRMNAKGDKLVFAQTKNEEEGEAPRWKVSLGVVPDYLYDGKGMRIDGVTDGKPASKAGLLAGDVVIKLGELEVTDMMSYMRALSKLDKGQTVTVVVLRKGKPKKKKITFF